MSEDFGRPLDTDIRIEREDAEVGVRQIIITAWTEQAQIDLETEYPRIVKLLERDWLRGTEPPWSG